MRFYERKKSIMGDALLLYALGYTKRLRFVLYFPPERYARRRRRLLAKVDLQKIGLLLCGD